MEKKHLIVGSCSAPNATVDDHRKWHGIATLTVWKSDVSVLGSLQKAFQTSWPLGRRGTVLSNTCDWWERHPSDSSPPDDDGLWSVKSVRNITDTLWSKHNTPHTTTGMGFYITSLIHNQSPQTTCQIIKYKFII